MEVSVLNRIFVVDITGIILMTRSSPVAGTVEEGFLTVVEAVRVSGKSPCLLYGDVWSEPCLPCRYHWYLGG